MFGACVFVCVVELNMERVCVHLRRLQGRYRAVIREENNNKSQNNENHKEHKKQKKQKKHKNHKKHKKHNGNTNSNSHNMMT